LSLEDLYFSYSEEGKTSHQTAASSSRTAQDTRQQRSQTNNKKRIMSASKGTAPGAKADDAKNLKQTRRRLSVMSDNKLIEGMDNVNLEEKEPVPEVNFLDP
jgi:hypothetical protein